MRPHRNPAGDLIRVARNQLYLDAVRENVLQENWPADIGLDARADLSELENWPPDQPNDWAIGLDRFPPEWSGGLQLPMTRAFRLAGDEGANPPRAARDQQEMIMAFNKWKALDLKKLKQGDPIIRDVSLPPFRVAYDTHEQINTKLNNTVIMIKDNPFYVRMVYDLGDGQFGLCVSDREGTNYGISYADVADCRPIAPGYVTRNSAVFWLYRGPERQNQQGMNHRTTFIRGVNQQQHSGARYDFLLDALSSRKDIPYEPALGKMIENEAVGTLRLSNNIALFQSGKKGAPIGVEYCGRNFGLLIDTTVKVLDEHDLRPSWIHKDLAAVNLRVRG